ncbi:MAG: carbohydrate-binding protein, partial [Lachnospiraceae bacterium]|nr:carbohydrate-binding protein [Lachnospiraceae bacterium]
EEERVDELRCGTLLTEEAVLLSVGANGPEFLPAGSFADVNPAGAKLSCPASRLPASQTNPSDTASSAGQNGGSSAAKSSFAVPIRRIALSSNRGLVFSPDVPTMEITASLLPENAADAELLWRVTTDSGIDSNLARLDVRGKSALITALGDGAFRVRCMTKNGTDKIRIISELCFTAEGLGSAVLAPYRFVSAGLYDIAIGAVTNGNERGIATARDDAGDTTFGFRNVDFGDFGSDEVTIPIFALSGEPYPIQIWEGVPGEPGAELLADVVYQKPSIWNVYQEETFRLNRRVRGLTTLCFTAHNKIHVKGFVFAAPQKAFARLSALDNSRIYGDDFTVEQDAVTGIGNNVSLEYDNMDFGERGFTALTICGRTPLAKNTIHVRFANADGEIKQIAEFAHSDDYSEQTFRLDGVTGMNKVTFVFLPGSCFDFKWFRFEASE